MSEAEIIPAPQCPKFRPTTDSQPKYQELVQVLARWIRTYRVGKLTVGIGRRTHTDHKGDHYKVTFGPSNDEAVDEDEYEVIGWQPLPPASLL